MVVNHKIQFFLIFLEVYFYRTISFLLSFIYYAIIFLFIILYVLFFIIRLFAGWRYAGRIFNAGICRGKAISEFRSPKALPLHPHPLGHGSNSSLLCVLRCWLLSVCCGTQNGTLCRSGFCILRYLWWYAGPICDLFPVFFDIYDGTLCRSGPCILRYLWWYTGPI